MTQGLSAQRDDVGRPAVPLAQSALHALLRALYEDWATAEHGRPLRPAITVLAVVRLPGGRDESPDSEFARRDGLLRRAAVVEAMRTVLPPDAVPAELGRHHLAALVCPERSDESLRSDLVAAVNARVVLPASGGRCSVRVMRLPASHARAVALLERLAW